MQLLMIGTSELLIIGGAVLLLFGGKKIPELMRSLGKGVKEFKDGMNEVGNSSSQQEKNSVNPDENTQEKTHADYSSRETGINEKEKEQ